MDLPSFAFDYSEYIIAAMIERSFELFDLQIVLFLLPHQIVLSRSNISYSPVVALSTDEGSNVYFC